MATPYPADNTISLFVVKIEKLGRKRDFKHELSVERYNHPSAVADYHDGMACCLMLDQ
jgi:hypothetical protein